MKIAVTGATGQLGSIVVNELKKKVTNEDLIALIRNKEKASGLGIETREFDYDQPEILANSLQGIDRLLLISGNEIGQRARQHKNVINAAKNAGVKWIVYTSLLHTDNSTLSLADEHFETEKVLKESGIDYTILRNGWYTENYTGSVPAAVENGAFIGSAGEGKISSAARADYAEAAAIVLIDEKHKGETYELAGDESYTLAELAKEISNQTGKNIPYNDLPEQDYAEILKNIGIPEAFAGAIAGWDASAAKDDLFDNSRQLSTLLGRPTTKMQESVKQILA